jgi:hypothetical protein
MPLKGTGEARGKLPRGRAWLRNHQVSPNKAGFDLREIFPLSQDLARWDSNRARKDGRDWSPNCTSPKDAKGHLKSPLVGWDSATSGLGHRVTATYVIPLSLLLETWETLQSMLTRAA